MLLRYAEGSLIEISSPAHKAKTGKGSGSSNSAHSEKPVDRAKFDKDREQYYKDRIKDIDEYT